MRARWGWLLGGAATAVFAAGLVGGIAAGQSGGQPSPTPTTTGTPGAVATTPAAGNAQRLDRGQSLNTYLDALARNLGVTPDALRAAVKQTALDQIAAMEASGGLTAAQAARAREAVEKGRGGIPPKFGRGRDGATPRDGTTRDGRPSRATLIETLARLANVTPAQLQQEAQSAGSLGAAARARGVTEQQVLDALTAIIWPQYDAAVAEGRLTTGQAEQLARTQARRYARQLGASAGGRNR